MNKADLEQNGNSVRVLLLEMLGCEMKVDRLEMLNWLDLGVLFGTERSIPGLEDQTLVEQ